MKSVHKTVLLVDDEESVRLSLSEILQIAGYRVLTAGSAEEAENILDLQQPDLLMCDMILPEKNGLSLISRIREDGGDLRIIVITGLPDDSTEDLLRNRYGVNAYLPKPFERDDLLRAFNEAGLSN